MNSDSYTVKSKGKELILHSAATQGFQNDPENTWITDSQNWKGPYLRDDCVSQDPWLKATDWSMDKLGRRELARRLAGDSEVNGRLEKEAWEWKLRMIWRAGKQMFQQHSTKKNALWLFFLSFKTQSCKKNSFGK